MDFRLTEEQNMMAKTARQIGERFGLDYWRRQDEAKAFPREFWKAVCDAGLCGVALPEEHGGAGLGMQEMALIIENLAAGAGGSPVGQLFMVNPIFGGVSISRFGTPAMKADLLPKIISGEINCCMALTEPDAGSNTLEIKTFAHADGRGWRLNGSKIWITAVPDAAKMLVVARTTKLAEGGRRTAGLSMFMIDVDRAGLSHQAIAKVGTNTLASSNVFFDNVRIEPEELVGKLDGGWKELLDVLNTERIVTTAGLVGTGELALRLAVDYANQRKVFGSTPISAYQGLQFLLAAQAVSRATERSMQTMGGMGFAKECHVERLWRDCRLFRFAPISEEMVLNYIAVHDLGMPRSY